VWPARHRRLRTVANQRINAAMELFKEGLGLDRYLGHVLRELEKSGVRRLH